MYVHIVYAVTLMFYYRHVFLTLISLSSGFTKELSVIHILRWEFLENALCCFSHMFLSNYFFLSFQFLVAEHGSVQKEKLTEDYNDAYPLIFLSFLWIDNSLRLYGKSCPRRESHPPSSVSFRKRLYEIKLTPLPKLRAYNSARACSDCLSLTELPRLGD